MDLAIAGARDARGECDRPIGLAQRQSTTWARRLGGSPSGRRARSMWSSRSIKPSTRPRPSAMVGKSIPYFERVGAGGQRTLASRPSGSLRIVGARLSNAGRTLTLATDPHPRLANYVVPLPENEPVMRQQAACKLDTSYDLSGVEATWTPDADPDAQPLWTGWWPALDLEATRRLTRGSKRHEEGRHYSPSPAVSYSATLVRLPPGQSPCTSNRASRSRRQSSVMPRPSCTGPVPSSQHHRAVLHSPIAGRSAVPVDHMPNRGEQASVRV